MVRTTIYLPEELKRELEARARPEGRSEADIIRDSLARTLHGSDRTIKDLRFGMFASGHTDTSTRTDDVVTESGFGLS